MNNTLISNENICVLKETQKQWKKHLSHNCLLYIYGMTGFGKTTQAVSFAEAEYNEWKIISATDDDFLNETSQWFDEHKKVRSKTLLILDDLQWIVSQSEKEKLFDLLIKNRQTRGLHIILISRAPVPSYLSPLWVTQQMEVEDKETLQLSKAEIKELFMKNSVLASLQPEKQVKMVDFCLEITNGYVLGVSAFINRIAKEPNSPETATSLAQNDVYDYLDHHLIGNWTASRVSAAVKLSVFSSFTKEMAKELFGEQTDRILEDFINVGSFLTFKSPNIYTFTPFFCEYLQSKLQSMPKSEWVPLYETAAKCYEQERDMEQALRCYDLAGRTDKIIELVIYLSENADGCAFTKIAKKYMDKLPLELEETDPRILGAKAMISAYRMETDDCSAYLERLRLVAENEQKCVLRGDALAVYVRTVIACPFDTADELKNNLLKFVDYVIHNDGVHIKHIMPTGNLPSLINGGIDLLPWVKNKKAIYPIVKKVAETVIGKEAVGTADASMGETLYEQNEKSKAMASLTKALSATDLDGSIRVQYAITGIMARLFQSENQADTAESILHNIAEKARQQHFLELIPNINASLAICDLLKNDAVSYKKWLKENAPNEHEEFYITSRFQLFVKAKVYTALGRELEALYIIGILEEYASRYKRTYFQIELLTLKAIILYNRKENWKEELLEAVNLAEPYSFIRVFADEGVALLPLWEEIDWEKQKETLPLSFTSLIGKECKKMALTYPNYLKPPRRFGSISNKEMVVLKLMAQGLNNTEIAQELGLNLGTVKFHVKNIMQKLQAENRTVAVKIAGEEGLL